MRYKKLRGTKDWLGQEAERFVLFFKTASDLAEKFGYKPIITPIIEPHELFSRSVGEASDIVQKEMYEFEDKGGRKIVLRPEGTAGTVRAYVEAGLDKSNPLQKLYYFGPMFRYEKPQAGRQREFYQFGLEAIGWEDASFDAEIIDYTYKLLTMLGIKFKLHINSIGCKSCRPKYRQALVEYLNSNKDKLCKTCQSRLEINPLRVLDCKEESCKIVNQSAPNITKYLCDNCREHFEEVKKTLEKLNIEFLVDPLLVRGLDYYTQTVFEFKIRESKSQDAVASGGRYNHLIEDLGGQPQPAVGVGIGVERVLLYSSTIPKKSPLNVALCWRSKELKPHALTLKSSLVNKAIEQNLNLSFIHHSGSFKAQMKFAGKNASLAIILFEEEFKQNKVVLKNMVTSEQHIVDLEIASLLENIKNIITA